MYIILYRDAVFTQNRVFSVDCEEALCYNQKSFYKLYFFAAGDWYRINGGKQLTVNIDGLNINYKVTGNGGYVFLLHGWGANLELFNAVADAISEKYTVVAFDFPGFGKSDEPKEPWSVSDYADFTVKFIKSFGCERVILLGHSFGGRVIIKMLGGMALPFEVEKIILVDSAGIMPKRSLSYKIRVGAYKAGRQLLEFPPVRKLFPGALEKLRKKFGSADYASASEVMRKTLVMVVNEDLRPLLKNVKVQTLLVWGDRDTATPLSDAHIMEKEIASAGTDVGLVVLTGAGHYSFIEKQYIFLRVIRSFLKVGE